MATLNEVLATENALVFLDRDPTPIELTRWSGLLDAGVNPGRLAGGSYGISPVIAPAPWGCPAENMGTMTLRITGEEIRDGNRITVGTPGLSNSCNGGAVGSTFSGTFDPDNPQMFGGFLDSVGIGLNFTVSGGSISGRFHGLGSGTFELPGSQGR